jgi:membrane-associated protease RseP (regulator of RpoE activity)
MPLAFFIITVICVFFDGLSRSGGTIPGTYVSNPIMMAAVYTMSLMGILGTHELGHMIALKHYEVKASWPYFIPGIPSFVPTFGALITQRSNMPNRNIMFDVGISGPVAGLIITMIVSIYGSSISSLIPAGEFHRLHDENRLLTFNTSLIMVSTLYLMGKMAKDMVLVMSPVLFTAWIGFALTSINLTPAWQLDGGHLARAALGRHKHRIVTYIGVGYLFVIGFWPMAILVLVLSFRIGENPPLDDVSPLSQRRKLLFLVAIGLAIVTAPIPTSIIPWA